MTLLRYPYKKLYWIWVDYLATVLRTIEKLEHRIETLYLKSWNIAVLTVSGLFGCSVTNHKNIETSYWNIELEWISYCVTKQTAPAEKYALTVKVKYCSVTQSCKLRNSEILHVPALLWPWLLKDWAYETYEAIVAQNQGTPTHFQLRRHWKIVSL